MLPEVQTYIAAAKVAYDEYHKASANHSLSFPGGPYGAERQAKLDAWYAKDTEINNTYRVARNTAWAKLSESDNALVRFIEANAKGHQADASKILEVLPAPLEELDRIADEEGFCDVFRRLRDRALEAGAVPGHAPLTGAKKELRDWARGSACMYPSQVNHLLGLVDAIVTEAFAERDAVQVDQP